MQDRSQLDGEFSLQNLPTEIVKKEVIPYLNASALKEFHSLFRNFNLLFQPVHHVTILLDAIEAANYEKITKIVRLNLKLMFDEVWIKYADGRCESISPLKLAFKLCDTYSWRLCLNEVQINKPEFLSLFQRQLLDQNEYINLEPLLLCYEELKSKYSLWLKKEVTNDELDSVWSHLGNLQRQLLPRHMLKELVREGVSWKNINFSDPNLPKTALIYNWDKERRSDEIDFPILRGEAKQARTGTGRIFDGVRLKAALKDLPRMIHLYKTRRNELEEQKLILHESFQNNLIMIPR